MNMPALAFWCLAISAAAQHTGSIEGVVTETPGGAPAANVPIDIAPAFPDAKWSRATTDPAGRYVVKDLAPGRYVVVARGDVDGYGKTFSGTLTPPRPVQLAPGQRLTVNLEVKKEIVLSGRVLDSDRNPVVNARVSISQEGFVHGHRRFGQVRGTRTDDLGEFRASGLAGGRYFIEAAPALAQFRKRPAGAKTGQKPRAVHVGVFYPGAPSPDSAAPIVVEAGGRQEGIDLLLPKVETYCVHATAPHGAGNVVLGLVVSYGGWSRTIAHGGFQGGDEVEVCGVPPGSYRLNASTWNDEGFTAFGSTDFVVGERHVSLGALHLLPGLKVPGRATVADAKADEPFPNGISVALTPKGTPFKGENTRAQPGPSGEFTIPNARADEYWLRVEGLPERFYVKEARMGTIDARREPVRAGSGELTITLASDGASVSGTVAGRDGDRVLPPDTAVVLAPASLPPAGAAGLVRTRQTDQNGWFEFAGLAPGEYRLLAFTGLRPGEGESPEFLQSHMTKAEEVSLRARENRAVKLTVLSAR